MGLATHTARDVGNFCVQDAVSGDVKPRRPNREAGGLDKLASPVLAAQLSVAGCQLPVVLYRKLHGLLLITDHWKSKSRPRKDVTGRR